MSYKVRHPGRTEWIEDGKNHRIDGPAIEWDNGTVVYYIKGKRHRIDGPAIIFHNGNMMYYINDELHREDGPAYIDYTGIEEYYIHGKELSKEEYDMYNFVNKL